MVGETATWATCTEDGKKCARRRVPGAMLWKGERSFQFCWRVLERCGGQQEPYKLGTQGPRDSRRHGVTEESKRDFLFLDTSALGCPDFLSLLLTFLPTSPQLTQIRFTCSRKECVQYTAVSTVCRSYCLSSYILDCFNDHFEAQRKQRKWISFKFKDCPVMLFLNSQLCPCGRFLVPRGRWLNWEFGC